MGRYSQAYDNDSQVLKRLGKIQIVIINNSQQVTDLLKSILEEIGFTNLFVVNNAFNAVQTLKRLRAHMIIIDSELTVPKKENILDNNIIDENDMQTLNGCDFVRRMRQSPLSPSPLVPIIMLTDVNNTEQQKKALDIGANEVVTHPLEAKKLFASMIRIIDKPRPFITAKTYKGPCRRLEDKGPPEGMEDRRKSEIRIIRYNEAV